MFEAKVYRVVVSTLGAILQEEHLVKDTIQRWNIECAEKEEKVFLTVPEDASVAPDLYVVVIDSYVDTAKVDKLIATGRPIAFFFSQYHDPNNSMQAEIDKVDAFKETVKDKYCCVDYNAAQEFASTLVSVLDGFGK